MTSSADQLYFVRASPRDADRLAAHERRVADRLYGPPLDRDASAREIASNALYFVEADGALAATAAWKLRDDGSAYLCHISVDPDFRRRGIARRATSFLLEEARDCARIDLVTHPDNAAAISLYRSLGFGIEGRTEDRVGDGEPRVVMSTRNPIATSRLLLRAVTSSDRMDLHRLEQDPEVMRYLNGGRPTPLEPKASETTGFLMPRGPELGLWAVTERKSDNLLGWVSLRPEGDDGDLGYRFFRNAWGRGFATEAARAVIADGFLRLGLGRITAQTMSVNMASRRVMQRLGMRCVRTFFADYPDKLPGGEQGDVEYSLLREEWRQIGSS
jgi:RimJ/RimL family protein N-acetyltransferase